MAAAYTDLVAFFNKGGGGKEVGGLSYGIIKDILEGLTAESADAMAQAAVPLVHGYIGPDTVLYLPAGCIYIELPRDADNLGIRGIR